MVKQIQIVAFAIIVIAVTALNVNTVLDSNRSYDLNMTTIAAISGENDGDNESGGESGGDIGGESGGDIQWNCSTITIDTYIQKSFCMLCNKEHVDSEWVTRDCNDGVFTYCYPGYIVSYYDCHNKIISTHDHTDFSGCN